MGIEWRDEQGRIGMNEWQSRHTVQYVAKADQRAVCNRRHSCMSDRS